MIPQAWVKIVDAATNTGALVMPAITETEPSAGCIRPTQQQMARIAFFSPDADGNTILYDVLIWSRYVGERKNFWFARLLATGVATLGAKTGGAGLGVADTDRFADTITDTEGHFGVRLFTETSDDIAWLEFNCSNAEIIQVRTNLGTAPTNASVLLQFGQRPREQQGS